MSTPSLHPVLPVRRANASFRPRTLAAACVGAALLAASPARALGPGSGTATVSLTTAVTAGETGSWSFVYYAEEGFPHSSGGGGVVEIDVPAGWTAPTLTVGQPGEVTVSSPFVSSVTIVAPRTIQLRIGDAPAQKFNAGDSVVVRYGGGGGAGASAQTSAPATALFAMRSDPNASDGITLVDLASGSPSLAVVPDALDHVVIEDGAGAPVGSFTRSVDEDTTHLHLAGYDQYGNPKGPVSGDWTVSGGIGTVSPVTGSSVVLTLTTAGTGRVTADASGIADSTGVITALHGAYASITRAIAPSGSAGDALPLAAEARDADGNVVTTGAGSGASLRVVAFADAGGSTPADPNLVSDSVPLASGAYSGAVTPRRAGSYWMAVRDDGAGYQSALAPVVVAAGPPHHLSIIPGSNALVAGVPDTFTVEVRDALENPSPVAGDENLALWTNRPAGYFRSLGGTEIFEVTVPTGSSSASFLFGDTQATTSTGLVRAIDTGFTPPFLGVGEATVTTAPAAPAGAVTLAASPDTLEADGSATSTVTSSVVRDAFGNAVAAGQRFTVTGTLVTPLGDVDAGTPGVQWATNGAGVFSGTLRAGTLRGAGNVSAAAVNGSASGASSVTLLAGAPAGAIALLASPGTIAADGASTSTISASGLVDANGNAVEDGERYTVATDLGSITTADVDAGTPGIQVAASGASITFTLAGGTALGTASVTAASARGSASGGASVALVPGAIDASRSLVAATSPAPVGPAGSTVTVTLRDVQDHAIAGVPADSIAVVVSGLPATVAALDAATNGAGALDFRVTASVADTASVAVTAKGVPLLASPSIVFAPGAVDHYTAAGPPAPLLAGRSDTLAVTARDAFENPVPAADGTRLSVRVVGGLAVAPDTVTLAGAAVDVPFTPTAVTQLTLVLREVAPPLRSVTYGPVAVDPAGPYAVDSVYVAAATIAAGDSTLLSVWIDDAYGNRQPGASVAASVVAGSGSATPATAATDAGGLARFQIHGGPLPGPLRVRVLATASPAPDSIRADTVAVTVIPGPATTIDIANATGGIMAGGLLNVNLTLRDALGNVALGAAPLVWLRTTTPNAALDNVRWVATAAAAGALADSTGSDGAAYQFVAADSGTATLAVRDTLAETIRLRVSGASLPLAETGPITIQPAPPTQIAVASGNGQSGTVADTLAAPLRVTTRDSFGNLTPGAVVRFTVTSGGGLVDAVLGGGPDSDAAADGSGVARCDVWSLGTAAGSGNQGVRAALVATPSAFVGFTASAFPDTAASLALAPASLALAPNQTAVVTATARDAYGNAVPGAPLTLYLAGPAHGALQSLGATTGGPGSQSGATDAAGSLAVRYAAPATAPIADSIYVRGVALGPVGIRADVTVGATDSLRVSADSLTWTAGAPVHVTVVPLDAQGNVVVGDAANAVMRAVAGVTFTPPSGALAPGLFATDATATIAGTIASIGADRSGSPGVDGAVGPITVRPAAPSGAIPVAASRTTLTADGRSVATVTFGPVHDAYGNVVAAGSALVASASAGSLAATSLTTDAAGYASTVLVAPSAAGSGTVDVVSSPAGASGSLGFTFLAAPSVAVAAATLAPTIVAPGASASFQVDVTNTGSGTITLGPATALAFGPVGSVVTAAVGSAPVALPSGVATTVTFSSVTVPPSLPPGTYAPTLRAVGTDATGDPFDFYPGLGGAAVHVAGIRVLASTATPSPAPLGLADLRLTFTVQNLAATAATIESGSLAFSQGAFTVNGVTPVLPAALPALATVSLEYSVRVPASGIPSGASVDATLTAGARYGAVTVSGSNASPLAVPIVSGAAVTAVAGGTTPARLLRNRTFAPTVRVANGGAADVTLLATQTELVVGAASGDTLRFGLRANQVVAGGAQADLAFDSLAVPGAVGLGSYDVTLRLRGAESGQPYAADVAGNPATMPVLDPSILAVTSLSPDTVSAGQSRPLHVAVSNAGGVPYDVAASTTLRLGAPVSTVLAATGAATIPAGGSATLDFLPLPLGSAASPGSTAATLEARGTEDGRARDESLAAGTLEARPPASIAYVAGSTSPDTVRAGQTVTITAAVRNNGGSPFTVDPASSRLVVTDGVESAVGFASGGAFTLAPAAQATLTFPSVAFPSALASQPYPVTIVVQGSEWALPESTAAVSPAGELRVVEPAAGVQVRSFDVGAPLQVDAGAGPFRLWGLSFEALVPVGGASSSRLESVALTLLVDGNVASNPGAAASSIEIVDGVGATLAQSTPGAVSPIPLVFASPIDLSSGAVDLIVRVTLVPGLEARDVALRLAAAGDVIARDNLTGSVVPVTATGGLPFLPLESRRVTLFAKAHGYPNPFRAGSESVLLSYRLGADTSVHVKIVTLLGELVRELSFPAGAAGGVRGLNEVPWDGRNGAGDLVASGVYVARVNGGGVNETIKVGVRR